MVQTAREDARPRRNAAIIGKLLRKNQLWRLNTKFHIVFTLLTYHLCAITYTLGSVKNVNTGNDEVLKMTGT